MRVFIVILVCTSVLWGCDVGELPEPLVPGTLIREVQLQNCDVPAIHIREREPGQVDDMWKHISMSDLCELSIALKRHMDAVTSASEDLQPGDWTRIESVEFYRMAYPRGAAGQPADVELHLYANIPGRTRLVGVSISKGTGVEQFFVVHR